MVTTVIEKQLETLALKPFASMVRFLESCIDTLETPLNDDGGDWCRIGLSGTGALQCEPYATDFDLDRVRNVGRLLARNPWGKATHENRVSYVIGWGHTYTIAPKRGEDLSEERLAVQQDWLDGWLRRNRWMRREESLLRRRDRDGEVFVRKFKFNGDLVVRFVEPEAVRTPTGNMTAKFGIETEPDDYETVKLYWVNGQTVDAAEMQHRTRGVDGPLLRGVPILFDVRDNLFRAARVLRNSTTVTEIQTAIAMIRKHGEATKQTVQKFVDTLATKAKVDAQGNTENIQKFRPGSIVDTNGQTSLEFPGGHLDPSKYIPGVQAELRAVASSIVMPEFMLTADASNGNFASILVADGPAVKMFYRLQQDEIEFNREIVEEARQYAAAQGQIPIEDIERTEIRIEGPRVEARDDDKYANSIRLDVTAGIMSIQTARAQRSLDDSIEQANIEAHQERTGAPLSGDRPGDDVDDPNEAEDAADDDTEDDEDSE